MAGATEAQPEHRIRHHCGQRLLKKGLVEERPALGNDPIWREVDGGKQLTLVISKAGLKAIGMLPQEPEPTEGSVSATEPGPNRRDEPAPAARRLEAGNVGCDAEPGRRRNGRGDGGCDGLAGA
jgi:hypothetical protein